MNREERLFALMRRWAAVTRLVDAMAPRHRQAIIDLFLPEKAREQTLQAKARAMGVTKARYDQIRSAAVRQLLDALFDAPDPPGET